MKRQTRQSKTIKNGTRSVTVSEANALMGIRHSLLIEEAVIKAEDDEATRLFKYIFYPAMVACVVDHRGFDPWPPTIDDVMNLPDQFAGEWMDAAWELNPHWKPRIPEPDETEKKSGSTSDSLGGSAGS